MIQLRARKKYFYYSLIRGIVTGIATIPGAIYALYIFFYTVIHPNVMIETSQLMLIWLVIPALSINAFFIIFGAFYRKHLRRDLSNEFYEIVALTKLPDTLPKVVYVYTSHGDMITSRLLQNSEQTYKNIEIWISEGSEKPEVIESSRKFAQKHGFKFYAVGGVGSSNKAENLNSFLKNACPSYDYLLITDADEALDKNFVDYAVRCFYWSKFRNLGYVSPMNYVYPTDNAYSNIMGNSDTYAFCHTHFNKMIELKKQPNLYSASCLISKSLLEKNNSCFPSGCLEDVYLESLALRYGYSSIILPITPCGQAYDKDVFAFFKRTMRVFDWYILLAKRDKASRYNEKYTSWFSEMASMLRVPLISLFAVVGLSFVIWMLICWPKTLFSNRFFIFTLCTTLGTLLLSLIGNIFISGTYSYLNKYKVWWIILMPFSLMASIPNILYHWWNSFVLSKYSAFGGSGQKRKKNGFNKIKFVILFLIIFSVILTLIDLCFIKFASFKAIWWTLGFTFANVVLGSLIVSLLSILLLFCIGYKKVKYNNNEYIHYWLKENKNGKTNDHKEK